MKNKEYSVLEIKELLEKNPPELNPLKEGEFPKYVDYIDMLNTGYLPKHTWTTADKERLIEALRKMAATKCINDTTITVSKINDSNNEIEIEWWRWKNDYNNP